MTVRELYAFLEERIPRALSCDWDNDGLMVCADDQKQVSRVLVALDITSAVAEYAIKEGYDLVVSHHPLIFHPIKAVAVENKIDTVADYRTIYYGGVDITDKVIKKLNLNK